ncbi:CaiB/BaiF CoA transferase family protein [Methylobacterium nodulans]|uniref:L-carnitine dehydratase/bile acid-inducible protein F n=1 Tax=Methylobacterium nodulans (strain LMG 21967 / CNCM I-2342 / ORS 2060) TaxID=460265 RepID=B8IDX1_METNO|nr:CoA transferase [Methylobacterium nodulans]ACL55693.1 L-carnitine dehydratase/bile acid-inducible protein F [Methylobacterium nodulans ORS 2060]
MMTDAASGALAGIRVVDLSRVLGGPYCTQILGDHGADVIKVEPPGGDETRGWGPPFRDGTASYFQGTNRNKRAITLDLTTDPGRDLLRALLADADVLVENFKPGTLDRWGFSRTVLEEAFPRLVHCRISGFGADGPLGGLPGYDACAQAMGGLMSVNGEAEGGPMRVGLPVVDMVTGLNAVIGIAFALFERERSGRGQFVDTTLYDCAISLLHPHAANFFMNGRVPVRTGNAHPNIAPYETLPTARGEIFLAIGNDRQFANLVRLLDVPHLAQEPDFATNAARLTNRERLRTALAEPLSAHEAAALAETLLEAGVPAAAVADVGEVLAHPHTLHRGMVVELDGYRGLGPPVKLSRTPASVRRPPPRFGEHAHEVLAPYLAQD